MQYKKLILNAENKMSITKLGAWVVGVAGTVIGISNDPCFTPLLHHVSWLIPLCKIILSLGGTTTIIGARNAMDKNKVQLTTSTQS